MRINLSKAGTYAVRNALMEYYQTTSKPALKKGKCSPFAKEIHLAVKDLEEVFINYIITH